ncbi:MAG: DUF11 domain-containing protein, partial [bacterium]
IGGVSVAEAVTGLVRLTDAGGRFTFDLAGGSSATLLERNPAGFISVTPDSVGPLTVDAGDTLAVYFADVAALRLSPGSVLNGAPGGYIDFPHRLDAGTRGSVTLSTASDSGVTVAVLLDANENGTFDAGDRPLAPGDLDMDPGGGNDHLCLLFRVFVPVSSPLGTTHQVDIEATQAIEGTTLTATARAVDAVVVIAADAGRLTLFKQVDNATAAPGDSLTYTITFTNVGTDSVQNILILDPVSSFVDPVPDAFGPGMDVEWRPEDDPARYLTLDPGDADECEYRIADRLIRIVLSKNSPFYLRPGETGTLTYRAVVK